MVVCLLGDLSRDYPTSCLMSAGTSSKTPGARAEVKKNDFSGLSVEVICAEIFSLSSEAKSQLSK